MSDLLPLMMMGGGMGGDASGMNSMLPLMLMGDSSSSGMSDLLPLMMMGGGMGGAGAAGGMDPMMMMLMLDSDDNTKVACDKKFKIKHAFKDGKAKITTAAEIRAAVLAKSILGSVESTWEKEYLACLSKPGITEGTTSSSNSLKDLLPLMMMGGMNGQAGAGGMDPMMMMMLMD
jgi:hypothetical protein